MSLGNCIPGLVEEGKLTKAQGKKAQQAYDRHFRRLSGEMGPVAAAAEASEAALRELEREAKLRKRQAFLLAQSQQRAAADMERYAGQSPYAAVRAMMDNDISAPYENVEISAQRIQFQAHAELHRFIQRFRRNLLGRTGDKTGMLDVVRELHGDNTGNAEAKAFSEAIGRVFEGLRQRFNAAGGAIAKLAGWGLPHNWDALKVRGVTYEHFRQRMLEALAPEKMFDQKTGGAFTPDTLEEALKGAYEAIRSNGLNAEAGGGFGQSKLANSRSDHRFFVFKDGAAWLRVHEEFGTGDPFTVIMNHIRGMSHDIATMERFGPSPDATVRFLLDRADRMEARSSRSAVGAITGTSGGRRSAERLWSTIKGEMSAPVFPEGKVMEKVGMAGVRTMAGVRDILTAALLGSSPLTAISDINTQRMALKFNGLPETGIIRGYIEQLFSGAAKVEAAELGLGMRDATRAMLGLSRYIGESNGPEITSIVADDVLRASGLNKFTEAGQQWFGRRMLREIYQERGLAFDRLGPERRTALERYGIDAGMWDSIRRADIYVGPTGTSYLKARTIGDPRAADRLMDMVLGETGAAVQEATAAARSRLVWDRPGTAAGEFGRNITQFKSFALGLMMTQGQRIAALPPGRRLSYAAQFLIGMTLFGALSIQLREIAKGRDPRPMDNWEFWGDSMVQGGGLGIVGDLFGSFNNDRIGSTAQFLGGPFATLAEDVKQNVVADWKADDEHEHKGRHLVRMLQRYTPGGNLWYGRLAFQRELLDRLSRQIDPTYYASWGATDRVAEQQGQGVWWKPGEDAPERAPDFATALSAVPE
ncbi:MAG: hypothetical protein QOH04_1531 [Sphingomonadales bacterium]|jgi:hypothetical protein|nr:hypothetical protein [Sphingomonadales bacterium]